MVSSTISKANLSSCDLSGADLQKAVLMDCDLQNAQLVGADLTQSNMQRANLSHANLQDAKMVAANLQHCILSDCNLDGADLAGVHVSVFITSPEGHGLCKQKSGNKKEIGVTGDTNSCMWTLIVPSDAQSQTPVANQTPLQAAVISYHTAEESMVQRPSSLLYGLDYYKDKVTPNRLSVVPIACWSGYQFDAFVRINLK